MAIWNISYPGLWISLFFIFGGTTEMYVYNLTKNIDACGHRCRGKGCLACTFTFTSWRKPTAIQIKRFTNMDTAVFHPPRRNATCLSQSPKCRPLLLTSIVKGSSTAVVIHWTVVTLSIFSSAEPTFIESRRSTPTTRVQSLNSAIPGRLPYTWRINWNLKGEQLVFYVFFLRYICSVAQTRSQRIYNGLLC